MRCVDKTQVPSNLRLLTDSTTQADVAPAAILKRVADSSGSKYSVHREAPKKPDLIAPVGTSYKPIGTPDIAAMRTGAPKDVIGRVVSLS